MKATGCHDRLVSCPCVQRQAGFSLIEVMVAMVVLAFGILGVASAFQWSDGGLRLGHMGTRALAMAGARLEAKRLAPWELILMDDVDADGRPDLVMQDDGRWPDLQANDGLYTAMLERDGISVHWMVQPDRSGPLQTWGSVVITVQARYRVAQGQWATLTVATRRANPRYLGRQ
jgi:prepilin-type N-terminal cleavage/methylation domain-containing protein